MQSVAALDGVHWVGEWKTGYKTPRVRAASAASSAARTLHLASFLEGDDGAASLRDRLEALGASVSAAFPRPGGSAAVADLSPAQLAAVADWPDVEWIEPAAAPSLFNDQAAIAAMMDADAVRASASAGGLGLTGAGQVVAMADTGLDTGDLADLHADLAGQIAAAYAWTNGACKSSASWRDASAHGTHVAGSILGTGAKSGGQYKGIAPGATLVVQGCWSNLCGIPSYTPSLFSQAYTNGARIHSDSWGYRDDGKYSLYSQYVDSYLWEHQDFLAVFSAGNEGVDADGDGVVDTGSVSSPGTAKNCLCVGAAENHRDSGGYAALSWGVKWPSDYPADPIKSDTISQTASPQGLAAFSGRGPTSDGRFKPDIVAPGTDIVSVRSRAASDTFWGVAANTNYLYMGGTSMATPLTSGALALLRQWLVERKGVDSPSAALLKALLVNGARDMAPGQYDTGAAQELAPRPDFAQGFGHVDLYNAVEPGASNFLAFATNSIADTYDDFTTNILVGATGLGPYRVTLAWQDSPAGVGASHTLVNDLDLIVTSPSGTVYYPNGLGAFDHTNNVEHTEFVPEETGSFSVRVYGETIAVTNALGGQPFALVVRGPQTVLSDSAPAFRAPTATATAAVGEDFYFDFADLLSARGYPDPEYSIVSSLADGTWEAADSLFVFTPSSTDPVTFACTASNSAGSATCTLTVEIIDSLPDVPVGLAVSAVSDSSFYASWSAVPNADAYWLDVATGAVSAASTFLSEDFSGFTTASGSTDRASSLDSYTAVSGWTGSKVYENAGSVKLGSGSANGWLATPALDLPAGTVLSCLLTKYNKDTGTVSIGLSTDGGASWTDLETGIALTSTATVHTLVLAQACTNAQLKIASSDHRFYLDDVLLAAPASTNLVSIPGYPQSTGTAIGWTVTGLDPATTYRVAVCASNTLGASDWSDPVTATTADPGTAPVWSAIPDAALAVGDEFEFDAADCVTGTPAPGILLTAHTAPEEEFDHENGYLLYIPQTAGTQTFTFLATNYAGNASATLTVTVTGGSSGTGYADWLAAHGLPADTDPDATAANGLSYCENYIADLDPASTNRLRLVLPDPPADYFLVPAASTNRAYQLLWTTNLLQPEATVTNDLPDLTPTNPVSFPSVPSFFGRVRVSLPDP